MVPSYVTGPRSVQSIKFSCSGEGNPGRTLKVSLVNSDQLQISLLNVIEVIGISTANLKGNSPTFCVHVWSVLMVSVVSWSWELSCGGGCSQCFLIPVCHISNFVLRPTPLYKVLIFHHSLSLLWCTQTQWPEVSCPWWTRRLLPFFISATKQQWCFAQFGRETDVAKKWMVSHGTQTLVSWVKVCVRDPPPNHQPTHFSWGFLALESTVYCTMSSAQIMCSWYV